MEKEAKLNMERAVACERANVRTNHEIVCELAYERREVSINLERLNNAIEANPDCVSEHHKELWRKQAPYVLMRKGHAKQRKKLWKAYHGNRLKKWWSSYASWECCTIAELKDEEHVGHRMKGGHHHRRNYCICHVCGNWFRRNKGFHDECSVGPLHFCSGGCARQAEYEASLEADVGGGFESHYWDDEEDAEWRRKK